MKTLQTNFALVSAAALALTMGSPSAFAQDPSCTRYLELTAKKPDRPYRVNQTIAIDGAKQQNEAVYIDGTIYTKQGDSKAGKWIATPVPDFKEAIEMAKKTTSKCTMSGTELLGGVPTQVWTSYAATPFEPKPVQWKTWIGVADGRVYRQASEGVDQRYFYDNVVAPPASEVAQPRKRK